jgi:hypothetical protein
MRLRTVWSVSTGREIDGEMASTKLKDPVQFSPEGLQGTVWQSSCLRARNLKFTFHKNIYVLDVADSLDINASRPGA